jgi:uncharacterized protein
MPNAIRPQPDELTQGFWDAAVRGELGIQRCRACGKFNHPPQVLCGWCSSEDLAVEAVEPTGTIVSFTSQLQRAGADADAHVNVVVELDVQADVLVVGRVPGAAPPWLAIGARVRARFDALDGTDVVLPQFEEA